MKCRLRDCKRGGQSSSIPIQVSYLPKKVVNAWPKLLLGEAYFALLPRLAALNMAMRLILRLGNVDSPIGKPWRIHGKLCYVGSIAKCVVM